MIHQMFNVKGMTCESCVSKITEKLSPEPKIENLKVTLNPPKIHFDSVEKFNSEKINNLLLPLAKYSVSEVSNGIMTKDESINIKNYMPLILIFVLCAGIPALNMIFNDSNFMHWMLQFMGATLISLAYFKLIDLPKFAEAFSTYDPIAMRALKYGYVYPFFELISGIGFLLMFEVKVLSIFVIIFLLPTTIGVIKALREKRKFQCACLGTAFNLPLTKTTIIENILMMIMSLMIVF